MTFQHMCAMPILQYKVSIHLPFFKFVYLFIDSLIHLVSHLNEREKESLSLAGSELR